MDKELGELFPELEKQGGSRFVHMMVKTWLQDGTEEWISVHLDIQNDNTRGFPHRMFQYWYRIYDRYEVNVVALAVFIGSNRQRIPNYYYRSFLGTEIIYRYNVYHILDHTEEQLLAMHNPFAPIILAAQKTFKPLWALLKPLTCWPGKRGLSRESKKELSRKAPNL